MLGILNAFKLVGQQGSGGIGTIGVAIAEALIVTGYGLMVAIPSVLLFNWLSTRIARYEGGLSHARQELVDHLAGGVDDGSRRVKTTKRRRRTPLTARGASVASPA